jgi:hypothetical protein
MLYVGLLQGIAFRRPVEFTSDPEITIRCHSSGMAAKTCSSKRIVDHPVKYAWRLEPSKAEFRLTAQQAITSYVADLTTKDLSRYLLIWKVETTELEMMAK